MSKQLEIDEIISEAQQLLLEDSQSESEKIKDILLALSMNEIDFELIQNLCLKYIRSSNDLLRFIAIISVGHVVRVYHKQVCRSILNTLCKIYSDHSDPFWGAVDDVYDDMEVYLMIPKKELMEWDQGGIA